VERGSVDDDMDVGAPRRRAPACRWLLIVAAIAAGWTTTAWAQQVTDLSELSIEDLMQIQVETVTGASKYQQLVTEAPASVTIITSDEIQQHQYRSLADILRNVRGFYVTYDRNYHYVGTRGFIRPGDYNSRVLVLIDGHRLNDNIFGGALLGQEFPVDIDLIDRVEVIRGPGSALYGASAMFGVVNVITRLGNRAPGLRLSTMGAGQGSGGATLSYGRVRNQGGSVLLAGTVFRSDGVSDLFYQEFGDTPSDGHAIGVDGTRRLNGLVNVTRGGLTVQGVVGVREKHVPTGAFGAVFNDGRTRTVDGQGFINASYTRAWNGGVELAARLSIDHYDYHGYTAYAVPDGSVINQDQAHGNWWTSELRLSKRVRRHRLTGGAEFRDDLQQRQLNFDVSPSVVFLNDGRDSDVSSVFVQDEWRLSSHVALEAGVRRDVYDEIDPQTNPRVALIVAATETSTVKALYGRAFRAPTVYELYWQQGDVTKPNPLLRPEQMDATELVLEQYVGSRWRLSMNGFLYRVRDLVSQTEDPEDGRLIYQNLDAADAAGIELEVEGKWRGGLRVRASQTLQRSRNPHLGERLSNSPASLFQFNASVPVGRRGLAVALDLQAMSRRRALAGTDAPAYAVANLMADLPTVFDRADITAGVWNLLGTTYGDPGAEEHRQTLIPQDGRVFGVKARVRF
jgi:outer membrane receptor for ferrienterochelin and colicins